jgi:membrane protease YdiL (CAAX protease family)
MKEESQSKRSRSLLALLLLVPVPSFGVLSAMILWPDSAIGSGIFAVCKLWLLLLPVVWLLAVDKKRPSLSIPRKGGFLFGLSTGIVISIVIAISFALFGSELIDPALFKEKMSEIGLDNRKHYLLGALYWITINSILEEYVWRWFVVTKSEAVFRKSLAVVFSALFFTLHHVIALSVYLGMTAVILCSLGVFIGGLTWSYTYSKYRSVWPCYLSHAIVDLCIFLIGASLLFET